MKLISKKNIDEIGYFVAQYICNKINTNKNDYFVICFPAGRTPMTTYKYLIDFYRKKQVSFKNVISFNMDEYLIDSKNHNSFSYFMYENLFNHIDILPKNINLLNGTNSDYQQECLSYENKIKEVNGIDFLLGGIGTNGHIAFNEPGSCFTSKTRLVDCSTETIKYNSTFFKDDEKQPTKALTIGLDTIFQSQEIMIIATGQSKEKVVKDLLKNDICQQLPASILKKHSNSYLICDEDTISIL